jgi:hypothetical protein
MNPARRVVVALSVSACLLPARPGQAQVHDHPSPQTGWTLNVDGVLFATFNRQDGPRGSTDFRSQNWLMAAAARPIGPGRLIVSTMLTLEPLTVGGAGYAHLLQVGETYRGLVNTDRQHPHELFSQLAAGWSQRVKQTTLTVMGGPVGEAALGPPAFMHRASAAANPTAPLSHHIFDSTHIASSLIAARVDHGWFAIEGSAFRGREPDDRHYDLQFGRPDSWAARAWFRPTSSVTLQASRGFLRQPEQLEPGDHRRTSASASWFRKRDSGFTAVTTAVGRNERVFSTLNALLIEGTHRHRSLTAYVRAERLQVETEALLFPSIVHRPHPGELADVVTAITAGGSRDVYTARGLIVAAGVDVTTYALAPLLQLTHGARPWSFHVFLRVGRSNSDKRMFDMTMAAPGAHGHAQH